MPLDNLLFTSANDIQNRILGEHGSLFVMGNEQNFVSNWL